MLLFIHWTFWTLLHVRYSVETATAGRRGEMKLTPVFHVLPWSVLLLLSLSCFQELGSEAQVLDPKEVDALKIIARKLNITYWDFNESPCNENGGWNSTKLDYVKRVFMCNCSDVCHITTIDLQGQNLTGELPAEFADFHFLRELDLTFNNLNGSIPRRWATLPLVNLSILGNRITGMIPKEFGNMITLKILNLEDNLLDGPFPPEIGNLSRLEQFLASANNFTGPLPETFGKLKKTKFLIDGNPISGKIPDFIGNWTRITRLDVQGTSMEGPIPSAISKLKNLTELRITDLVVPNKGFPPLETMKDMKKLVLRNCLSSAQIPDFIGNSMSNLVNLDLSFNNLTGKIPGNFDLLSSIKYMYLTNNMLTGDIPGWVLRSRQHMDLSNNNFTGPTPPPNCQQGNVNLVASYSSTSDGINLANPCFRKRIPCTKKPLYYSLFINCGGNAVTVGNQKYEEDSSELGPSTFFYSEKWAHSSTGDYADNEKAQYILKNTSVLKMSDLELHKTARTAPLSLKYYGICLQNGNYKVQLHFAEIEYTNDQTYLSNGRRLFDVSIQSQRVLKDFNIEEEAGGYGQEILKTYDVNVTDNTLEIHLYWAGKGTNAIPYRGFYGPLISAIAITPNFKPDTGDRGLSIAAILGIAIASCFTLTLVLLILYLKGCLGGREVGKELGVEFPKGYFKLKDIKLATNNFDPTNKIGEGGFGPVYKGTLSDGTIIAVKQLSSKSKQGNREFINEIGLISALQHPNLVKLFGCCVEGNQLLVVYEYMENNSLARALFGPEEYRLSMDWPTRCKICMDIAKGLFYLHEESRLKIVHRDIKASNILLDKDLNAKISDFGLAKLDEEENSHINTRIAGTIGYMAPEYAMRGYLTDKADVYSFGVVILEIVSGKSNTNYRPKEDCVYLLDEAYVIHEQGNLLELVDPSLGSSYSKEEAWMMLNLALLCTNLSPTLRPTMSTVVLMLEGKIEVHAPILKRALERGLSKFRDFEMHPQDSFEYAMPTDSSFPSASAQSEEGNYIQSASWVNQSVHPAAKTHATTTLREHQMRRSISLL